MSSDPSHESNPKCNEDGSEETDPQQNPCDISVTQTQPTKIEQGKNGNQRTCEGASEKSTWQKVARSCTPCQPKEPEGDRIHQEPPSGWCAGSETESVPEGDESEESREDDPQG
jgi:hypothetical protein